jgi:HlyD family secretion protein
MMNWLCALPLIAGLFNACGMPEPFAVGYVEGEYVLLAPIETARIETISVRKGERVEAGQLVVKLETRDAIIAVDEARAAAEQAEAELANLKQGKRPEEIAVIEASLASARAQAREAQRKLQRQEDLREKGFASQAEFDTAETAVELAQAKVDELQANLTVARLPAREEEIVAASNRAKQARAALENAQWRLDQRMMPAPAAGTVSDVVLREGEVAGPSAPVLSLLPDGAIKLKLYIPEESLSSISKGSVLQVHCDGCGDGQTATVNFISDEPEFTPPVIYSVNNRQKLVYLIEALPNEDARLLKPGQIVDVALPYDLEHDE